MCIAVPMQVKAILPGAAICDHAGVQTYVDTQLVGELRQGEWLLNHAGVAIQRLSEHDARLIRDALEAAARAQRGEDFEHLFADLTGREPELPPHLRGEAE